MWKIDARGRDRIRAEIKTCRSGTSKCQAPNLKGDDKLFDSKKRKDIQSSFEYLIGARIIDIDIDDENVECIIVETINNGQFVICADDSYNLPSHPLEIGKVHHPIKTDHAPNSKSPTSSE